VVAICDHLGLLVGGQLEHEVARKAALVSLHLLVEPSRRYPIKRGQIRIEDHLLATNEQDPSLDVPDAHCRFRVLYPPSVLSGRSTPAAQP